MVAVASVQDQAVKATSSRSLLCYARPRVGWLPRLFIVFVLGYALSPIDLIPDFIPILGILDDVLLLPAMFWLAVKLIPLPVMESATRRAQEEPLRLRKNWFIALLILVLWEVVAFGRHRSLLPEIWQSILEDSLSDTPHCTRLCVACDRD